MQGISGPSSVALQMPGVPRAAPFAHSHDAYVHPAERPAHLSNIDATRSEQKTTTPATASLRGTVPLQPDGVLYAKFQRRMKLHVGYLGVALGKER